MFRVNVSISQVKSKSKSFQVTISPVWLLRHIAFKTAKCVSPKNISKYQLDKLFELIFAWVLGPLFQVSLQCRLDCVKHAASRLAHTLVLLFPVLSFYPSSSKRMEYMHTASKLCIHKSLLAEQGHSAIDYRCQCKEHGLDCTWSICTIIQWTALSRSSAYVQGNHLGRPFNESFFMKFLISGLKTWSKPSIHAITTYITEQTFRRTCIKERKSYFAVDTFLK